MRWRADAPVTPARDPRAQRKAPLRGGSLPSSEVRDLPSPNNQDGGADHPGDEVGPVTRRLAAGDAQS
jgi:hypothetical protein